MRFSLNGIACAGRTDTPLCRSLRSSCSTPTESWPSWQRARLGAQACRPPRGALTLECVAVDLADLADPLSHHHSPFCTHTLTHTRRHTRQRQSAPTALCRQGLMWMCGCGARSQRYVRYVTVGERLLERRTRDRDTKLATFTNFCWKLRILRGYELVFCVVRRYELVASASSRLLLCATLFETFFFGVRCCTVLSKCLLLSVFMHVHVHVLPAYKR
jgi:hypothetical protein